MYDIGTANRGHGGGGRCGHIRTIRIRRRNIHRSLVDAQVSRS